MIKKLENLFRNAALILVAALTATSLAACGGSGDDPDPSPNPDTPTPTPSAKTSHGLVVFCMGSGTGLQDEMDKNVTRIVEAASKIVDDNNKICIFYDRVYDASNKNHETFTRLTEVKKVDGRTKQVLVKEWNPAQTSTVDPAFMTEVLKLARQTMNTKTYGLVMSSHGGGWVPSDTYDQYVQAEAQANGRAYAKGGLADGTSGKPLPLTKFFGEDSGAFMEVPQLAQALKAAGAWDYLLFDACFMASVEALYDLRSVADYIIASPAEVMAGGFPYSKVIPELFDDDDEFGHDLEDVCEDYMESYKNSSATVALVRTSKLEALAAAAKPLYAAAASANVDVTKLQGFEGFNPHLYFDFAQYMQTLGASNAAALATFNAALKEAVPYAAATPTITSGAGSKAGTVRVSTCCGLTCHVPVSGFEFLHTAWLNTDWAKNF